MTQTIWGMLVSPTCSCKLTHSIATCEQMRTMTLNILNSPNRVHPEFHDDEDRFRFACMYTSKIAGIQINTQADQRRTVFSKQGVKSGFVVFHVTLTSWKLRFRLTTNHTGPVIQTYFRIYLFIERLDKHYLYKINNITSKCK